MKIVFYIGTDRRHVDPTFRRHFAKGQEMQILTTFVSRIFGGGTIVDSRGVWSHDGEVVIEPGFVVTVFVDEHVDIRAEEFVNGVCQQFQQREIVVERSSPEVAFVAGK